MNKNLFFQKEIKKIKEKNLYREFINLQSSADATIKIQGKEFILLCSNNYLGLTTHPKVKKEAILAIKKYGTGAGASRFISGNFELYEKLENELAKFKRTESALVFATGYLANTGTISALMNKKDLIISDELVHASLIDGCRLSKAKAIIYPHNNLEILEKILKENKNFNKKLIVTEGIFSMEGDISPLAQISPLAKKYQALLLVDDAHGTGVLGKEGRGICEYFNLKNEIFLQIGTFSKALGSLGGFVCGKKNLIDYLRNKARSLIYSTALPPSVLAASLSALKVIEEEPLLRKRLWENVHYFKAGLTKLGYNTMNSPSHIIPILIGDTRKTQQMQKELFNQGILAVGIRPPSVPEGKSRIRITVMANHKREQLERALNIFKEVGEKLKII